MKANTSMLLRYVARTCFLCPGRLLVLIFLLPNAYAINLPSTNSQNNSFGGASFVSEPDKTPEPPAKKPTPVAKAEPAASAPETTDQTDPLTTMAANQQPSAAAALQVAANNVKGPSPTTEAVKTPAGCPVTCPQKAPITVKKELIQQIVNRQVNSSNANEIEQLMGPACSCITFNPTSADIWTCQWKGDLSSNRLENTINITFEGGMLASVTAVRSDGITYMALPNANVTVYQPQ